MHYRPLFFLLLVSLFTSVLPAAPLEDFAAAREAYEKRDFRSAIDTLEKLVRQGETRPEIFYNLALAHEQAANPARAILNLERALWLAPTDRDARAQLEKLSPSTPAWWNQLPRFGTDLSLLVAVVGFWIVVLSWVARWRRLGDTQGLWTVSALLGIFVVGLALTSLYYRDLPFSSPHRAIVLKQEKLRSTFTESSPSVLTIKPGQAVEILSINGPWTHCRLPDQTRGWIASTALEVVALPRL